MSAMTIHTPPRDTVRYPLLQEHPESKTQMVVIVGWAIGRKAREATGPLTAIRRETHAVFQPLRMALSTIRIGVVNQVPIRIRKPSIEIIFERLRDAVLPSLLHDPTRE